jgi:hypothetical protein
MKKFLATSLSVVVALTILFGMPGQSMALLIDGPDIIAAPEFALDDAPGATNDHQQAFNEEQNVLLSRDLEHDYGILEQGWIVSSHMIFLNTPVGQGNANDIQTWAFDGEILGVMSDRWGTLEEASNDLLGWRDTLYPGSFNARGMEDADWYEVSGNEIQVRMSVSEPGDWIRVVTRSAAIPEPGTIILLSVGLIGLIGLRRKLKK